MPSPAPRRPEALQPPIRPSGRGQRRGGRPTLLVFTLGPRAETRRRRLLPAAHGRDEAAFHAACLEGTLAAGRAAGCELLISSPSGGSGTDSERDVSRLGQPGRGFGQRLAGAVAEAEARGTGGSPLVVVGSDTPDLSGALVREALARLEDDPDRVVVGPSPDGGLYLLASRRPLSPLLGAVRWQRRSTLRELRAVLEAAGLRVELLAPRADLDRRADLERWLSRARRDLSSPRAGAPSRTAATLSAALASWVDRLTRILADLLRPPETPKRRPVPVPVRVPSPRGPPRR